MKLPALLAAALIATSAAPAAPPKTPAKVTKPKPASDKPQEYFKPSEVRSAGNVTVHGQPIAYDAVAGTLVVHAKEWEDTDAIEAKASKKEDADEGPKPEASMYYLSLIHI